jgi:HD-GYP domain-containing protein (c-di-GMP phosphodiesterase class II)
MTREKRQALHGFLRSFAISLSNGMLYSPAHRQTVRLASAAHADLLSAMEGEEEISFMVVDEQLIVGGEPVGAGMYVDRFVRALKGRGVEHLRIGRSVTAGEITSLTAELVKRPEGADGTGPLTNIVFGKLEMRCRSEGEHAGPGPTPAQRAACLADVPESERAVLMEIYEAVKKHRRLRIVGIADVVTSLIHACKSEMRSLLAFAPLREVDEYTFTHSTNVCILNIAQARAMDIDGQLLHDIGVSAMLHDIGKLFIPEEVLNKPGRLTEHEWRMIQEHPQRGAQYLLDVPGVPRLAVVAAYEHHMKYNHTGYPRKPESWRQNLCSQMTTISDYFDAMRTKRAYRDSLTWEVISDTMMKLAGTELHPVLTRNFVLLIERLRKQESAASPRG